jgi:hypothetical protein
LRDALLGTGDSARAAPTAKRSRNRREWCDATRAGDSSQEHFSPALLCLTPSKTKKKGPEPEFRPQ